MLRYAWPIGAFCLGMVLVGVLASAALAQQQDVERALEPFKNLLLGIVKWLLGPGRLVIALAWLVVGFKVVMGMERGGIGGFLFVALVGLAIVNAPRILAMLGITIEGLQ